MLSNGYVIDEEGGYDMIVIGDYLFILFILLFEGTGIAWILVKLESMQKQLDWLKSFLYSGK